MRIQTILDKVKRYAKGLRGLKRDDVILVSYPKSGNTWVRFFLCNLVTRLEGGVGQVDFAKVDSTMPELAVDDLELPWPYQTIPRIVKTHNPYWFAFSGKRVIYVIRDPRDVMVSHFHFVTGKAQAKWEGPFEEFIRHPKYGLENWFRHVQSWQGHWTLICHYEDLLANDVAEFRRILTMLGASVDESVLTETVEASRFSSLKQVVEAHGHTDPGEWKADRGFMRKGQHNDWINWFSEDDLAYFEELKVKYNLGFYEEPVASP